MISLFMVSGSLRVVIALKLKYHDGLRGIMPLVTQLQQWLKLIFIFGTSGSWFSIEFAKQHAEGEKSFEKVNS